MPKTNPLFKLIDEKTLKTVCVIQARDAHQADERIAIVLSIYQDADWLKEPEAFDVAEQDEHEPIRSPAFLDGFFAVLGDAYCSKVSH